ncbi:MAG: bifunctional adenosylcobinamide kinase/adenosylcobinamide-phosphate guanylyltransferase [Chloroflexi bacterium]|nr:bifunctional adenosylcobinamide kinase/adenosylcobinamide-phosphate guanylyltransferase [Chloroflexota bacterium]
MGDLVLVLGGTRSGKSRYAAERARRVAGDAVTYIATAWSGDPELDARIAAHRRARPAAWATLDAEPEIAATIAAARPADLVLLDSITLWISATIDDDDDAVAARLDRAIAAARARPAGCVVVSDEAGLGLVPANALARRFVDRLGIVAQRLAHEADDVVLMVAGIPLSVKPAR